MNNPKLAGLIILIVSIGFLGWGYHIQKKASASESWPAVQGQITTSKVERTFNTSSSGNNKWQYKAIVKYSYEVDGTSYSNDRIDFSSVNWSYDKEHKAKRVVSPYPKGKSIEVHYNPLNPEDAVLVKGTVGGTKWAFVFGTIGLLLGGVLLFGKALPFRQA